jgi:hypothetical protein
MNLTWRQITAFLEFSDVEQAQRLVLNAVAAQGDGKLIEQTRQDLNGRAVHSRNRRRRMAADDS